MHNELAFNIIATFFYIDREYCLAVLHELEKIVCNFIFINNKPHVIVILYLQWERETTRVSLWLCRIDPVRKVQATRQCLFVSLRLVWKGPKRTWTLVAHYTRQNGSYNSRALEFIMHQLPIKKNVTTLAISSLTSCFLANISNKSKMLATVHTLSKLSVFFPLKSGKPRHMLHFLFTYPWLTLKTSANCSLFCSLTHDWLWKHQQTLPFLFTYPWRTLKTSANAPFSPHLPMTDVENLSKEVSHSGVAKKAVGKEVAVVREVGLAFGTHVNNVAPMIFHESTAHFRFLRWTVENYNENLVLNISMQCIVLKTENLSMFNVF